MASADTALLLQLMYFSYLVCSSFIFYCLLCLKQACQNSWPTEINDVACSRFDNYEVLHFIYLFMHNTSDTAELGTRSILQSLHFLH